MQHWQACAPTWTFDVLGVPLQLDHAAHLAFYYVNGRARFAKIFSRQHSRTLIIMKLYGMQANGIGAVVRMAAVCKPGSTE